MQIQPLKEETYIGCDCMCLNHIAHFVYFPSDSSEDDDNQLFLTVTGGNFYTEIIPPFSLDKFYWDDYFRFHYLRRVFHSFKYLFKKWKDSENYSVLDSFDFDNSQLDTLYRFLEKYDNTKVNIDGLKVGSDLRLKLLEAHKDYYVEFYVERMIHGDDELPWVIKYDVKFFPEKKVQKRLQIALMHIISGSYASSLNFELSKLEASILKKMIKAVQLWNSLDDKKTFKKSN